jgi:hypothetical protein
MRTRWGTRGFGLAAGAALGILLLVAPAFAGDDEDEDTFEQKIIKNIMSGIGAEVDRPGIEYRERSPLVIPPTRDLPAPQAKSAVSDPAWPNDPDQKKPVKKAQKFENGSVREFNFVKATVSPDELRKGALPPGSTTPTTPQRTDDGGRNLSPGELGYSGGLFSNILGGGKSEQTPFTGEPPRTSLTQPPSGYQTPSPNYPYGVGAAKANTTKDLEMVKDHAVGSSQ